MDTKTSAVERIPLPGPAGHSWLDPSGGRSYVAVKGSSPGVAVVDH